jgi:hypothetical protein
VTANPARPDPMETGMIDLDFDGVYFYELMYRGYFYALRYAPGGLLRGGYCVWAYTQGQWVLQKAACEPGFECGPPPAEPGLFDGDVRRTVCRPSVASG